RPGVPKALAYARPPLRQCLNRSGYVGFSMSDLRTRVELLDIIRQSEVRIRAARTESSRAHVATSNVSRPISTASDRNRCEDGSGGPLLHGISRPSPTRDGRFVISAGAGVASGSLTQRNQPN